MRNIFTIHHHSGGTVVSVPALVLDNHWARALAPRLGSQPLHSRSSSGLQFPGCLVGKYSDHTGLPVGQGATGQPAWYQSPGIQSTAQPDIASTELSPLVNRPPAKGTTSMIVSGHQPIDHWSLVNLPLANCPLDGGHKTIIHRSVATAN